MTEDEIMTLKQKQDIVMQFEVISRLEEEKEILLSEMEDYLMNIRGAIDQNTTKLKDNDISNGTKALVGQQLAVLNAYLAKSVETFRQVTDGRFAIDMDLLVSPNDNVEELQREYEEINDDLADEGEETEDEST